MPTGFFALTCFKIEALLLALRDFEIAERILLVEERFVELDVDFAIVFPCWLCSLHE